MRGVADGGRGDQIFCCRRSRGADFSAADVPGQPLLGGNNFRVTVLVLLLLRTSR